MFLLDYYPENRIWNNHEKTAFLKKKTKNQKKNKPQKKTNPQKTPHPIQTQQQKKSFQEETCSGSTVTGIPSLYIKHQQHISIYTVPSVLLPISSSVIWALECTFAGYGIEVVFLLQQ